MRRSSPAASASRPAAPGFAPAGPLSTPPEMLKSKTAIWNFPQKALSLYYKKRERPAGVSPLPFFPWGQGFRSLMPKFWPLGLARRSLGLSAPVPGIVAPVPGIGVPKPGTDVSAPGAKCCRRLNMLKSRRPDSATCRPARPKREKKGEKRRTRFARSEKKHTFAAELRPLH